MSQNKHFKVISLNIEFNRHLNLVIPFFKREDAEVLLLQEVLEEHLSLIREELGIDYIFTPLAKFKIDGNISTLGIAVFSKLPIRNSEIVYYSGDGNNLPVLELNEPDKMTRALIMVDVRYSNTEYRFINTHFTWTPDGELNEQQRVDLKKMLVLLNMYGEFAFCGDFNAPRGKIIFDELARNYKDNIPQDITSTIDPNLHRRKNLNLVVDGIFTTPGYIAKDVKIIDGVSDHCAIVANIQKLNI